MEYKLLGRTKLKVSAISFGGGPLQVVNQSDSIKLILKAEELGINLIDFDKVHKDTEKKIGLSFQNSKKNMIVSAKSFAVTEQDMDKAVLESFKSLNLNSIDIYQLHMIQDEKDLAKRLNGSLKSLKKMKSEGKIKFIGLSGHHIPTLIKAVKTNEFDTALIPYNLGHTLADELIDIAKEHDVGIMVMKPLGGGFLIDPKFDNEKPKEGAKCMTTENALRFILSDKRVSTVLVGFKYIKEIEEAVRAGNKKIDTPLKERFAIRDRILNFLGDDYCRNCKYCMPCKGPNNLDITEVLRLGGYYSKYGYKNSPRRLYNNLRIKADACINCGECEKKCPYHLSIRNMLKQAHTDLSSV